MIKLLRTGIIYIGKDSAITTIKLTISPEQAKELIDKLGLISTNTGFTSGFSWRREVDMKNLEDWRTKKYCNKS